MEKHNNKCKVIASMTIDGNKFRPSDWVERMSGNMSNVVNQKIYYSPLLHPAVRDGIKCLIMDEQLKEVNPGLYQHIITFSKKNNLKVSEDKNNNK